MVMRSATYRIHYSHARYAFSDFRGRLGTLVKDACDNRYTAHRQFTMGMSPSAANRGRFSRTFRNATPDV
jgi:hypothetical protein